MVFACLLQSKNAFDQAKARVAFYPSGGFDKLASSDWCSQSDINRSFLFFMLLWYDIYYSGFAAGILNDRNFGAVLPC